jgi:hypothetical protein
VIELRYHLACVYGVVGSPYKRKSTFVSMYGYSTHTFLQTTYATKEGTNEINQPPFRPRSIFEDDRSIAGHGHGHGYSISLALPPYRSQRKSKKEGKQEGFRLCSCSALEEQNERGGRRRGERKRGMRRKGVNVAMSSAPLSSFALFALL